VIEVCRVWKVNIVNGSPYHPQTQGQVEKLNGVVKSMLRKWQEQEQTKEWARAVRRIFHQMNITVCSATRTTPYELVFGRPCRQDCVPITDPLYLQVLMNQLSDVDSADQRLTAADELTRLAVAAAEVLRGPTEAALAATDCNSDQVATGVDVDVSAAGGREATASAARPRLAAAGLRLAAASCRLSATTSPSTTPASGRRWR
jgi:hypothetical protein